MSVRFVLFFVLVMTAAICNATIFFPLPFEKQVEEATAAVEATLASTRVFKNAVGLIMTEYIFKVDESFNLASTELENEKLKLTMPGGTYQGITSAIDGAPQFISNEKSFLLLKKIDSKIYLSNFSLGKFKIENRQGKTYYISEVFPEHPDIGKISKEEMVELMAKKWKNAFVTPGPHSRLLHEEDVPQKAMTALFKNNESRKPAQAESTDGVPLFFWGAFCTFILIFAYLFLKIVKSGHKNKSE